MTPRPPTFHNYIFFLIGNNNIYGFCFIINQICIKLQLAVHTIEYFKAMLNFLPRTNLAIIYDKFNLNDRNIIRVWIENLQKNIFKRKILYGYIHENTDEDPIETPSTKISIFMPSYVAAKCIHLFNGAE